MFFIFTYVHFYWELRECENHYFSPWFLKASFFVLCAEACQAGVRDSTSQKHRHEWRGKGQRVSARGEEKTLWALQGRCLHFCELKLLSIIRALKRLAKHPLWHSLLRKLSFCSIILSILLTWTKYKIQKKNEFWNKGLYLEFQNY